MQQPFHKSLTLTVCKPNNGPVAKRTMNLSQWYQTTMIARQLLLLYSYQPFLIVIVPILLFVDHLIEWWTSCALASYRHKHVRFLTVVDIRDMPCNLGCQILSLPITVCQECHVQGPHQQSTLYWAHLWTAHLGIHKKPILKLLLFPKKQPKLTDSKKILKP